MCWKQMAEGPASTKLTASDSLAIVVMQSDSVAPSETCREAEC